MRYFILAFSLFTSVSALAQEETQETITGITWEIRSHSSSSGEERNAAALVACQQAVDAKIATANTVLATFGGSVSYDQLTLISNYNLWSETQGSTWGSARKHKAGGTADCSYTQLVTMPDFSEELMDEVLPEELWSSFAKPK